MPFVWPSKSTTACGSTSQMPSPSISGIWGKPNSSRAHNMPKLSTPRIVEGLISIPLGNTVPGSATATTKLGLAFAAPQTIWRKFSSPTLTKHTCNFCAEGWGSIFSIRPITTLLSWPPYTLISSTSKPWRVRIGARIEVSYTFCINCLLLTMISISILGKEINFSTKLRLTNM